MASGQVDRIDSIYDIPALTAQQKVVEDFVKKTIDQIKKARKESIDFNVNTKSIDDYNKKIKELEKTLATMQKSSDAATKSSILLAKQKEAEAKALLATQRAAADAAKELDRSTAASAKAGKAAQEAARPYKQLEKAFLGAAKTAQDLAAQYGKLDPRAQAAAKRANELNTRLKEIDDTVGISNRRVGSYTETMEKFSNKIANVGQNFLALIGVVGAGSFLKDSIDEFIEMDKNVRLLQNTLRNQGVGEAFDRIEAAAKRLAKQFTYLDDDDILKVFNQLLVYGKLTEDQMNELIPVIIDFAAATGQDLSSATSTIIKALEGNGKALKEYGINIKDAKSTTEAFGIIMNDLAPKVAGVGKAFGDSASGGLAASQQRFKDLKEEIGSGLLPVLNSVLSVLVKLGQGAVGFGRALTDALSGMKSVPASILENSDNKDIAFESQQVFNLQMSGLKNQQELLKKLQSEGKKLNVTDKQLTDEFIVNLKKRLEARELEYEKIKQTTNKQNIMSAIADIRGLQRAIQELDKTPIKPTTDPDKPFSEGPKAKAAKEEQDYMAQIRKANAELDKEYDLKRANDEKRTFEDRIQNLINYGADSQRIIEMTAEQEIKAAKGNEELILKITNDKNNALIRLATELGEKVAAITAKSFKTETEELGKTITGMTKSIGTAIAKMQKEFADAQKKAIDDAEEARKQINAAFEDLVTEVSGLILELFTNPLEKEKNAIQDQIDLLEQKKQKEIEVANSSIANATDRAAAIAVIEARAEAQKKQLELKQRQIDQQKARYEKAAAVAGIIQATALAVAKALPNVALAAVVGAIGAIQLIRAIAQPIPKYKDGKKNHPGGLAVVGDGGRSEGIKLPDGTVYKTPATATVVDLPKGSDVYKDYSKMSVAASGELIEIVDTTPALKAGFNMVVGAIKKIPQPIIHAERAWTRAHKIGSSFRNYLNQKL